MKTKMVFLSALPLLSALALPANAAEIIITSRHEIATTGELRRDYARVGINDTDLGVSLSDPRMSKTVLIAEMSGKIEKALRAYEKVCDVKKTERPSLKEKIIQGLLLSEYQGQDAQIREAYKILKDLRNNMLSKEDNCYEPVPYQVSHQQPQNCQHSQQPQQQNQQQQCQQQQQQQQQQQMGVGTGGAMDAGQFRAVIQNKGVPYPASFTREGFMAEFDLSLTGSNCESLLCVKPAYLIDRDRNKLFVQIGMSTMVTEKTFKRRPLNLSLIIDVSGSMDAKDGTEKTRLEWAKLAAKETVRRLNTEDTLSIVLFDDKETVLLAPTSVSDKDSINEKISTIVTGGSTNLESGLRRGFELVSEQMSVTRENRVILISDAGLNTGIVSQEDLVKMVGDFAGEEIGLTAIGVGVNFNQTFVHGITMSKGGNYLFLQSGKELTNYFNQFDFLTTPVAYNFKADLEIIGLKATLVDSYGIPKKAASPVQELVDIRTLFLTSSDRGGATLLEYELN